MVSNGPFRLTSWQRGQSMTLARNVHYQGRFAGNLEQVALSFAPYEVAFGNYDADRLDLLTLDYAPIDDMDRLRQQHADEYLSVPDLATYHLRLDLSRPPFDDRRVRRAFAMATDRRRLADVILAGRAFPATGGQVPPGMAGHSAGIALPFSPREAKQLLAEAGYAGGRDFPAVELLLGQGREPVVRDLCAQWRTHLDVRVSGQTLAWAELLQRAHHRPAHILGMASAAHYPDPATFVGPARRQDEHPAYVWQHEHYDRLVAEAAAEMDQGKRLNLYQQMDRLVTGEVWLLPLWYGRRHLLVKPWVARLPTSPIMGCFWKDVIVEPH
jgi:oligopeptide transport system substrate-binding protein